MKQESPLYSTHRKTPSSAFEIQDGYLLDKDLIYDKKLPSKPAKKTFNELIKE